MVKPDKDTLEALARIANSEDRDLNRLFSWINAILATEMRHNPYVKESPLHEWGDGRIQVLNHILDTVRTAPDVLVAIREAEAKKRKAK